VRPLRDGEVNPDRLPVQLFAVHLLPRLCGVIDALEVDEGEAPAAARVTVQNHLTLLNAAESGEMLLQLPLGGVEAQAEHAQALVGLRSLPVIVSTPSSASSSSTAAFTTGGVVRIPLRPLVAS